MSPRTVLVFLAATLVLGFVIGNIVTAVVTVAVTAAIVLIGHKRGASIGTGSRWRVVPLATGVLLVALVWITWGAAIVLAPIGVILTIAAFRRLPTWRDPILFVGAVANAYLAIGFLVTATIVAHEALK